MSIEKMNPAERVRLLFALLYDKVTLQRIRDVFEYYSENHPRITKPKNTKLNSSHPIFSEDGILYTDSIKEDLRHYKTYSEQSLNLIEVWRSANGCCAEDDISCCADDIMNVIDIPHYVVESEDYTEIIDILCDDARAEIEREKYKNEHKHFKTSR